MHLRLPYVLALLAAPALQAQVRATPASYTAPVREVSAVFIRLADCCDALTKDLRAPIDSVRSVLRLRALRAGEVFRMVGVSLDWDPKVGWNYISQFGEFDEVGLGSNWFGLQPEILIWSGAKSVEPKVPQLVIIERTVTMDSGLPTFGPRRVLRALSGRDQILAWVRAGSPLP